jgi:uncharacterized protein
MGSRRSRSTEVCVGVISDTHGLLRAEALTLLHGVDHIIHAGDIGSAAIIAALDEIAPVTAVRGNNDKGSWAEALKDSETVAIQARQLYVLHDLKELEIDPVAANVAAVITGHSHKPSITDKAGVLYLNPGSAGPRRFKLPITVAKLYIRSDSLRAEILPVTIV